MTTPKVPESIRDYLREIGLTLWACQHPSVYHDDRGAPTTRPRADKTRVQVQLAGPGLGGFSPWGYGLTVMGAVNDALSTPHLRSKRAGLDGAMARLEIEMAKLQYAFHCREFKLKACVEIKFDPSGVAYGVFDREIDDDIPF